MKSKKQIKNSNQNFRKTALDIAFEKQDSQANYTALLNSIGIFDKELIRQLQTKRDPNKELIKLLTAGIDKAFFELSENEIKNLTLRQIARFYLLSKELKQNKGE
jgi:hypothetical protein